MGGRGLLSLMCCFAAVGCVAAVESEPAYAEERFLCAADAAREWSDAIDDCRRRYERDASCGGVISFEGLLEDHLVTVDAEVSKAEFVDFVDADGASLRDNVKIYSRSPYFLFSLQLKEIGGATVAAEQRTLRVGNTLDPTEKLTDAIVRPSFRMSVGGDSADLAGREGELVVERQNENEQAGSFTLGLGAGDDQIDGCFHVFATHHELYTQEDDS